MRRIVAKVLVVCIVFGLMSWGIVSNKNVASASVSVKSAIGTGRIAVKLTKDVTDTWKEQGYWSNRIMAYETVDCKATVTKGTKCGYITITGQVMRESSKIPFTYNGKTYQVYQDAFKYIVQVEPISSITVSKTKYGATPTPNTTTVYPASELLTVDMSAVWSFGTTMTSGSISSYPNQPEGGIYIYEFSPKTNCSGSTSYNVFLSWPFSVGTTVEAKYDYLQVTNRTSLGGRKMGTTFDYKKWSGGGHACDSGRQKVVFGTTTQEGTCAWYTYDSRYKLNPQFVYSMTLCRDSKSTITEMRNGTFTYSYIPTCEWK